LVTELEVRGLQVEIQKRIDVFYKGKKVGVYVPDIEVFFIGKKLVLKNRIGRPKSSRYSRRLRSGSLIPRNFRESIKNCG